MAIRKIQWNSNHSNASTKHVARIYKHFYERYKTEYVIFLTHIEGILNQAELNTFASLMLTRLMFLYFLQHKHLLDDDLDYLSNRLKKFQNCEDTTELNFYHDFLIGDLFKRLSNPNHSSDSSPIGGSVPFLNIDLFKEYQIERNNNLIQISNEAFEGLFSFFDTYCWQLDNESSPAANVITPDIFEYIFERQINQKQTGAYYTQGDITAYIAKSTIIPFLFNTVEKKYPGIFRDSGFARQLLKDDPDRYIYPAIKKGVELAIPPEIEQGLDDVYRRSNWNGPALDAYALPTETWREVIARRQHYQLIRMKLEAGEPHSIDDLIIFNLDICQFAQDVIERCEDHKLLHAFHESILSLSVLDPTCGTGAFLLAALAILEPLYTACLDRQEQIMPVNSSRLSNSHYSAFEFGEDSFKKEEYQHSHRRYSILKSIVTSNLFGVDIMEEALGICTLRIYLKLLACFERAEEIEPLPNLSNNIRNGNALLGDCKRPDEGTAGDLKGPPIHPAQFSSQPCNDAVASSAPHSAVLQGLPSPLREAGFIRNDGEADDHEGPPLPQREGSFPTKDGEQPFHWFVEFNAIMNRGGFDVIIGNPPYIEFEKAFHFYQSSSFTTSTTGNLYALIMERCAHLLVQGGRLGMIVPASATTTDGYLPLQKILLEQSSLYIASFSDQRGKLFDIPHPRLCIIFYQKNPEQKRVFSTPYLKPEGKLRGLLFQRLKYIEVAKQVRTGIIPRYGSTIEQILHVKLYSQKKHLGDYQCKTGSHRLFFTRKLSWFVQVTLFIPRILDAQGSLRKPSELKTLHFPSRALADIAFVALNSNLFYWYLTTSSDCRNLNMREVLGFPLDIDEMTPFIRNELQDLAHLLTDELIVHSEIRKMSFKETGELAIQCLYPGKSKTSIDEIDRVLAKHYGFTDEELDFIINYDVKYRTRNS